MVCQHEPLFGRKPGEVRFISSWTVIDAYGVIHRFNDDEIIVAVYPAIPNIILSLPAHEVETFTNEPCQVRLRRQRTFRVMPTVQIEAHLHTRPRIGLPCQQRLVQQSSPHTLDSELCSM